MQTLAARFPSKRASSPCRSWSPKQKEGETSGKRRPCIALAVCCTTFPSAWQKFSVAVAPPSPGASQARCILAASLGTGRV